MMGKTAYEKTLKYKNYVLTGINKEVRKNRMNHIFFWIFFRLPSKKWPEPDGAIPPGEKGDPMTKRKTR